MNTPSEFRELEAYHAAVVRTALDGIVVIDGDGLVVDFNPAAEAIFGYARDAVIGEPIAELIIPPEHRTAHEQGLSRYLATGAGNVLGKRLELPAMLATGELIPIELTITDVTLGGRRLFAAHIRDQRAARRAEAEIRELADLKGRLPNTATKTTEAALGLAYIGSGGNIGISASRLDNRYGVPIRFSLDPDVEAEAPTLDVRQ